MTRPIVGNRARIALAACLAACLTVGTVAGDAAAKTKKKPKGGTVTAYEVVNQQIPDSPGGGVFGTLRSTIELAGPKLTGFDSRIRDVNVTVQTTGSAATSGLSLQGRLTAPNGASVWLFAPGAFSGPSVGPLTFDDETPVSIVPTPGTRDPTKLGPPYSGTAQPYCFLAFGQCSLSLMDGGPAPGTWSLMMSDASPGAISVLNSWTLRVTYGPRYRTKR